MPHAHNCLTHGSLRSEVLKCTLLNFKKRTCVEFCTVFLSENLIRILVAESNGRKSGRCDDASWLRLEAKFAETISRPYLAVRSCWPVPCFPAFPVHVPCPHMTSSIHMYTGVRSMNLGEHTFGCEGQAFISSPSLFRFSTKRYIRCRRGCLVPLL